MRTSHRAQLGGRRGAARRSSIARTLHLIMANLDVTDAELADRLQTSRQTINSRRKGRVTMTADDVAELARALDVEPALFLGQPSEAVAWLVEHRRHLLDIDPESRPPSPIEQKGGRRFARHHNGSYQVAIPIRFGIAA